MKWRRRRIMNPRWNIDAVYLARYLDAVRMADFQEESPMVRMISVHFPVGVFPQLYQESPDRPWRSMEEKGESRELAQACAYRHSRYRLPVQRAVWIAQGRRKRRYPYDSVD